MVWLAFGAGVGLVLLTQGLASHRIGQPLQGVGMLLFGCTWFMTPLLFRTPFAKPMRDWVATANETAIGPPKLRTALAFAGFACLCVGAALRYGFDI